MAASGRERGLLFLVFSIVGALGVTMLIYTVIQDAQNRERAQRPEEQLSVVVASRHIPPGWTITEDMLETRSLLANYVPAEAIGTPEEVVGRVASERILSGEFVRDDRLAAPEAGVGIGAIIPRGMRAYQVNVRGGQGMAGFLSPGNFVDIIAVCNEEIPDARTILQSVMVLGVNDKIADLSYDDGSGGGKKKKKIKPSITVALTPADTVLVKHAQELCEIYFTLRNDIDVTNVDSNEGPGTGTGGATGAGGSMDIALPPEMAGTSPESPSNADPASTQGGPG